MNLKNRFLRFKFVFNYYNLYNTIIDLMTEAAIQ